MPFGEMDDEGVVLRHLHRVLAPARLRAGRRQLQLVPERGVVARDAVEQALEVGAHALHGLPRHGPDLEHEIAVPGGEAGEVRLVVVLLVDDVHVVHRKPFKVRVRGERHPRVLAGRGEAGAEAPEDLALLLDGVPERGPRLVAEPEEEVGGGGADAGHDDADADVRDGVGGVLEVDAQVRGDAVREERPGTRPAVLVGDHRADEDVARESRARTDDRVDRVHHRGDAALVVVRPHAPDPAVLELRAIGVDAPAAHLHPGVHVPVQHETRSAPRAGEPADRLPADDGRVAGTRDVHHLDLEPDAAHVLGEVIRDRLLLERRARDADEGLLEVEHPLGVHERQRLVGGVPG